MSQPTSSLLPALVGYYQRLQNDPNESIADYGFSVEKIHLRIVLEPDGSLYSFDDIRDRNDKGKPIPRPLLVPDGGGRAGSGLKPFFCWDNTGYVLGRDNKGKPERSTDMFGAFRDFHKLFLPELKDDEGFAALCRFLDQWDPAQAEALPNWEELAGLNVVFKLRAHEEYIHQRKAVQAAWLRTQTKEDTSESRVQGVSLMSGEVEDLARLHPQLRGVAGANTMGAAIVSFNLNAFESYGKSQSFNAPVGTRDAFRYTTALNRLLANEKRKVRIGDATVVFWSDRSEAQDAEDLLVQILGDDAPKNDEAEATALISRLRGFLNAAREGRLADTLQNPEAPFYILGLSPNASRLNIRYWLTGTVRQFAEQLVKHVSQLEIIGTPPDSPPLVVRKLLLETAREPKDIPSNLAGEVTRTVLLGLPYPTALFNAVMRRIRSDSGMNYRRASILKAFLIRNRKQEVSVALNKEHSDESYQLGRLFAVLEYAQTNALGDINRSVKDAYFGTAAATPASVFPRLMRLNHHHLEKLPTGASEARQEKSRTKGFFERLIQEIYSHISHFPSHLSLENQGIFYIGYFHQRQDFFTKRTDTNTNEESTNV